jgi:hypothetical protein
MHTQNLVLPSLPSNLQTFSFHFIQNKQVKCPPPQLFLNLTFRNANPRTKVTQSLDPWEPPSRISFLHSDTHTKPKTLLRSHITITTTQIASTFSRPLPSFLPKTQKPKYNSPPLHSILASNTFTEHKTCTQWQACVCVCSSSLTNLPQASFPSSPSNASLKKRGEPKRKETEEV